MNGGDRLLVSDAKTFSGVEAMGTVSSYTGMFPASSCSTSAWHWSGEQKQPKTFPFNSPMSFINSSFFVILSRNIFTTFFLLLCSRMVCGFPHREPSCLKVPLSISRPTYTPPASIQAYTSSTLFRLMMFGTEGNGICGLAEGFVVSVSVT